LKNFSISAVKSHYLPAYQPTLKSLSLTMHLTTLLTLTSLALSIPTHADIIENDIVNNLCKPLTLIFARGALEPGNMGLLVGSQLSTALKEAVGEENVAVQGVEYNSFMPGVDPEGTKNFVEMVGLAERGCPETEIAISGYRFDFPSLVSFLRFQKKKKKIGQDRTRRLNKNQNSVGSILLREAAHQLSDVEISSVVTFGDGNHTTVPENIKPARYISFCHEGDVLCEGTGDDIQPPHLTYGKDAPEAAAFIKSWFDAE
jgi:cutinase